MTVHLGDKIEGCLRGVSCVRVFWRRKIYTLKDGDDLVLEGGINHPTLIIYAPLLLVFLEEEIILPGQRLYWDGLCSSQIGRDDKGGVDNTSVLIRWMDDPEVDVMPYAKVALYRSHVHRH